jgi:hypothetical protein
VGAGALQRDTTGDYNTAIGLWSLQTNTTGTHNTASGSDALNGNTTGIGNTATGSEALAGNTIGSDNTASGVDALENNSSGNNNTVAGAAALFASTTGNNNTALGSGALRYSTTGSDNIGVGYYAGKNLTTGSSNIDIGNVGAGGDAGTIRLGTAGTHRAVFVAGVATTKVTGGAVYISASGQLGTLASAERYKTDIAPMGAGSGRLGQLRPVTFRLKDDASGALQYGLVAEEVAAVYPELVVRDETGAVAGVRYEEIAPTLLNEVQQQQKTIAAQDERIAALEALVLETQRQIALLQRPPSDQRIALK